MRSFLMMTAVAATISLGSVAAGQHYLMVPQSGSDTIALFDPYDGSLVDANFIDLTSLDPGTPKHAIQVGDEIWVSDQLRDRIDRFDLSGNYLSTIGGNAPGGGLDNIRGMALIDGVVYVANAGTNNSAPGEALVQIDPATGSILGHITVSDSPWSPIAFNDNLLLSFSGSNSRIDEFTLDGALVGTFHQGDANFIQQIHANNAGGVYAAAFSGLDTRGIYEYDDEGNQIGFWNVGAARGVWELGNGNVMWTSGAGIDVLDPATGNTMTVLEGSSQFIGELIIPAPGGLVALGLAGLLGTSGRRRRR